MAQEAGGIKVGELFVALGLTDDNKVVKGLQNVNEKFKDVASSSLQTKLAIAGALYGLEKLTSSASETGRRLFTFREAFGLSTRELQKWEHWARRFGAENEIQGAIEGIQKAVTQMELGGAVPEAFARLNIKTQGQNAFQILGQIDRKLKMVSPRLGQWLVEGIGINSNLFQALRSMHRAADSVPESEILSREQIDRLHELNIAWRTFWFNLQRSGELMAGDFGLPLINSLQRITTALTDLSKYLLEVSQTSPEIKSGLTALGVIIGGVVSPVAALGAGLLVIVNNLQQLREMAESPEEIAGWLKWLFTEDLPEMASKGAEGVGTAFSEGAKTQMAIGEAFLGFLKQKIFGEEEEGPDLKGGVAGARRGSGRMVQESLARPQVPGPQSTVNENSKTTNVYIQDVQLPEEEGRRVASALEASLGHLVGIK